MIQEYISSTGAFGEKLSAMLQDLKIEKECKKLEIDHVCLRLKNPEHVASVRKELESIGKEISCENVNGRDIMIFQLDEPLHIGDWKVYGIELPFPKPNHKYEDGWEHVEFVLSEAESTMSSMKKTFFEKFNHLNVDILQDKYEYSEDMPEAEGDQLPNPTISVEADGIGVKFHAKSIQEVVA